MTFKFKDNNTKNELKTSMAVFSTSLLANNKEKKVTHLVKVANKYSGLEMDSIRDRGRVWQKARWYDHHSYR
ncbi:MAG: hypothetical protein H6603_05525 [Flavobacteriales bacterium]|nr:hypothetical protein [Flavobacteriales bacterium]